MDTKVININVSTSYNVFVGRDLLVKTGELVDKVKKPCKVLIITDAKVSEIYGSKVAKSMAENGFKTFDFVVKRGETSKSIAIFENILEYMAENKFHRDDLIIALGGGVVGDLAGFVAAVYNRGIDFVQIPTTFLSAIDSSVGGKTALNLKSGKNLVGAFKQPILVICDLNSFNTLEDKYFKDGIAEAIKYSILKDEEMFQHFEEHQVDFKDEKIEEIVIKSIEYKREIVREDEFDTGLRQLLNLGHTIGHSIEIAKNYEITHGHAVAIGTYMIAKAASKKGYCESVVSERIKNAIIKNGLDYKIDISVEDLFKNALKDKKATSDSITLVIPEKIGKCKLEKVSLSELKEFIELGKED